MMLSLVCLFGILIEAKVLKDNRKVPSHEYSELEETSSEVKKLADYNSDGLKVKARQSAGPIEDLQEIVKCCPECFQMDKWYSCSRNDNVDKDIFTDELLEIGAKEKEKYVIMNNKD